MIRLQLKSICIYLKIAKIKEIEAGASIKFIIFEHVQYRFNEHIHTYTYIYIYIHSNHCFSREITKTE